MRYKDYVVF